MTRSEDRSPETAIEELAEILASGFLRLRGRAVILDEDPGKIGRSDGVNDNITNGSG